MFPKGILFHSRNKLLNKPINHLMKKYLLLMALLLSFGLSAYAQDSPAYTCLFGTNYNSDKIGSYSNNWTATNNGFTWNIVNFNNNNNGWSYVKCGTKTASVATITTANAISEKITKIEVVIDAITVSNVNSITLKTSDLKDFSNLIETQKITPAKGTLSVTLESPAENLYYQISFDCKAASNGIVQISKVMYYAGEVTTAKPGAPTFTIGSETVTGTYLAEYNSAVDVTVSSKGADSLTFESPEGIGTKTGSSYTLTDITTRKTIKVYGTNGEGDGDPSTLEITFKDAPVITVDAPVFSFGGTALGSSVEVKAGSVITVATETSGATVTLTASPADAAVISGTSATINAACQLTATASLADKTATSTLDVTIKEEKPVAAGAFKLLTDLNDLKDGMEVILAYDTYAVGADNMAATNNKQKFKPATIVLNDEKTVITDNGEAYIFTLSGNNADGWYFDGPDGYITATAKKTDVSYTGSATTTNKIKITKQGTSNLYSLVFNLDNGTTPRALLWSTDQNVNLFGHYATSNAGNGKYFYLNIYYRDSATEAPVFEVAENTTFEIGSDGKKYFTNPFEVTLTSGTEGATIHYSINGGDEQSGENGNPVTFTVSNSQSIVAYATKDGLADSETVTVTYTLRTARPTIVCNDPEEAESKTVTISSATNGAYVQYSLDNGTTWSEPAQGSVELTFNEMGKTVNILARAYSGFEAEGEYSDVAEDQVAIYPILKWQPFELLNDITKLVPGDEVIFVAPQYNMALVPYVSGENNCKATSVTPVAQGKAKAPDAAGTITLNPASEAVGIYKVEKTDDGKFRFKGTFTNGYLAAVAGTNNRLVCLPDNSLTDNHASEATVIVDPMTGYATITFDKEGVSRNTLRYFTGNTNVFSCYEPSSSGTYDISIYRRGAAAEFAPRPVADPQEGVYDEGAISEVTLQCFDADGNVVSDPTLSIYYTLDGTDPRMGGKLYTAPIPVTDNMTVRAYATMDGYFDSPSLIASYDIFRAGKQYRRVTPSELRHLSANDDIIILGSPSDEEAVYALSRRQHGEDNDAYREAVRLDNVVKSDGRITINKREVQVLTLIPAVDYYTGGGYDWRLYASGSSLGADYNMDGYLLAQDNNNALETQRIDTPASEILPNADVRFRSDDKIGNEYGGLAVQFGSSTGHEDDYPKLMALTRSGDSYRFDVRKQNEFDGASASSWYVSVFKIFDENHIYAPSFTNMDLRITPETEIEITSPNTESHPETEIWYSLDGGNWILYSGPFTVTGEGEHTILARTRNAALEGADSEGYSEITTQTYIITDNEVFELVTDVSSLKENDRIVFVNAIHFPYGEEGTSGWYAPALFDTAEGRFEAELVDVIDDNDIPQQIIVPSESNIQVFRLEFDTSAADPDRPWLLNAGDDKYLRSAAAKKFELQDLPDEVEQRQYMNVGFDIGTSADYGQYNKTNNNYSTPSNKVDIEYNATVTFNGTKAINYLRFNPQGGLRFRGYDNGGKGTPSASTWPVRIYRATKRVLPPTMTVYDATAADNKAYETEIETFNNAVRVVIRHNPKTDEGTDLLYSWSKSLNNAPVLSEYLPAVPEDAKEIQLRVDGDKVQILIDGEWKSIDGLSSIEGRHVLRAVAADEMNASESLPRLINFQCAKPLVAKAADSNAVSVTRPTVYTVNATLYYAYDDDEMVIDDAHRINYVEGTVDFETIPFDGHEKVRVVAVKKGYANSEEAVYTPYTFTPRAHAIQLLELTDEGKNNFKLLLSEEDENFIPEDAPCYVTYRTIPNGQFYLLKETGLGVEGEFEMAACTDNIEAGKLIKYRPENSQQENVNVKFTTDYYVHVLDESEFFATVGESATIKEAKVYVNGSANGRPAQAATFKLNGEDKVYHGVLLKRYGAIGTIMLKSEVAYKVINESRAEESYHENGYDQITPVIPSVYGGHYAYVYSQEEQDLSETYPTDFLKFKVESRVKKNDDGTWAQNEVLIPTADLNPRHFNAVITFYRPNVSDEILRRNDIYYTVDIKGTKNDVKGSGLYVDRAQANLELGENDVVPEYYQFTVTDVSPRSEYYPILKVTATEYVENYVQSTDYGRFASNYGDNLEVHAQNIPAVSNGKVEKIHLGKLEPGQSDLFGNRNSGTHNSWMYKGHYHLDHPGDIAHTNADNTEAAVALTPVYYHVETYTPGVEHYASYEYLVKHVPGHNPSDEPLKFEPNGDFITDDDDDPLLGTYIATEIPAEGITVAFTPVYIFSRNPEANPDGENEQIIAQLDKEQSYDTPAVQQPAAKAAGIRKAAAMLGSDAAAPVIGEVRPMRHYGSTDMQAANITDLTTDAPFDVVPGNIMARTLEDGEVTGVENVTVDNIDGDAEYYNLQGIRIYNPAHGGIYIKRQGNTSEKVVL